ncbi:hypothetical protein Nepgr_031411 [Nepenthes gracilis]|uniref:Uncharacterized protein n=1 Tax=Nepenthes gracilis TaxID=150966 RepID=A0AAD3TGI0_NEPGR|nr:hypothetical protein Nepgr_031411 [Nepenthes gracilis]
MFILSVFQKEANSNCEEGVSKRWSTFGSESLENEVSEVCALKNTELPFVFPVWFNILTIYMLLNLQERDDVIYVDKPENGAQIVHFEAPELNQFIENTYATEKGDMLTLPEALQCDKDLVTPHF